MENDKTHGTPALSLEAKLMLLGAFANPRARLTFGNVNMTASAKARKGLEELMVAGLVRRTVNGQAETFTLTEAGQELDRRQIESAPLAFMEQHGRFRLAQPVSSEGAA